MKSSLALAALAQSSRSERLASFPTSFTLSKALTGGTLPLAATIARHQACEAFLVGRSGINADALGRPSWPIRSLCAAANASLDLFCAAEPRLDQVAKIAAALRAGLEPCGKHHGVLKDVPGSKAL